MSLNNSDTEEFFAGIGAIITFLICFVYAIAKYGLLLGGGLGWIPSLIIAVVAYYFISIFGKLIFYIFVAICLLGLYLYLKG